MIDISDRLIESLNSLKKNIFFELLELAGRVFIIVDYDESVVIGERGFLPEEKVRGIVLVFNKKMKFLWEENVLTATLFFGNKPERCYIPVNFIAGVFSPDLRVQLNIPTFKNSKINKNNEKNIETLQTKEKKSAIIKKAKERKKNDPGKVIDINKLRKKK